MSKLMLQYIEEQKDVLTGMVERRGEITGAFVSHYQARKIDRIFLVGSGSSYHAGCMAKNFMEHVLGVEVTVQAPTRMQDMSVAAGTDSICILVSQSGRSTNSEALLRGLLSRGCEVTAVTESHESPVAKAATLSVRLECNEELRGAKTKGLSGSVMTLMLLALELAAAKGLVKAADYRNYMEQMTAAGEYVAVNYERSSAWYETVREGLKPAHELILVAMAKDYGAAMEGALKMLETVRRPVFAYEFEEFLHGVASMLGDGIHMLYLVPAGADRERYLKLCGYAAERGASNFLISDGPAEGAPGALELVTVENEDLKCFAWLVPLQIISARLSFDCGIDISKSDFARFAKIMGSKL